jgi:arginyl-tRNA synthetase
MFTFEQQLTSLFEQSFNKLGFDTRFARVVVSNRPELCQFQCNAAMALAKIAKKAPIEIANQIIENLPENSMVKSVEAVMPGFINITLTEEFLAQTTNKLVGDERQGVELTANPKKSIIDYCGANIAKSMHVGHLRATIIGESIKRITKFVGDDALGDIHYGDWGTQMGMVITAVKEEQPDLVYFDASYEGEYPQQAPFTIKDLERMYPDISGRCKENEELAAACRQATVELQQGRVGYRALWKHIVNVSVIELKKDLADLNVDFDLWLGEASSDAFVPATIEQVKESGITRVSEGATIVDVTAQGKHEVAPLMLLKSDGAVVYATTDLATIKERVDEFKAQEIVYVVDGRQSLHFYQVFDVAKRSGIAPNANMIHAGFGTVNGTDGKPFKTRSGGVLKLRDLIEMGKEAAYNKMLEAGRGEVFAEEEMREIAQKVGVSAIKFADLMNHRSANYIFDIEKFVQFEGKTGPYLLYTDVRIRSMLAKAKEAGLVAGDIQAPKTEAEINLMLTLDKFKVAVAKAYEEKTPNVICDHAFALTQAYARFYNDCHILNEEDKAVQAGWLSLSATVAQQLELIFDLLGLQVPAKM